MGGWSAMVLLMAFAFLAGAGTAVSPCVLPVLPVALAAGATGGSRRPAGLVIGLTGSFTFAAVALVYVISALGLPNDLLRKLAIVVLLGFGVSLLVPPVAARLEAALSLLTAGAGIARGSDGFWSGVLVGASLGLVYAPCAGPLLAGVITVSASQPFTAARLAIALCYALGSGAVLYLLMLGGRRVSAPLARRSGRLQLAMGAVMVLVAVAMWQSYDLRFETALARHLPSFLVNPTDALESTSATRRELADLHRRANDDLGVAIARAPTALAPAGPGRLLKLPLLGAAPEFVGTQRWFNTPGGRALSLRGLRGRVVLLDFWTYSCINCLRTLPYLKAWDARYRPHGLTIVGVHTPEFAFEREPDNVAAAIDRHGLRYPVVQDNDAATWSAYQNQYWPGEYFIDARGRLRYAHFGEGDYERKERVIRTLLSEAGRRSLGGGAPGRGTTPSPRVTTPESYLGAERAKRFVNGPIKPGLREFGDPPQPPDDHLAYRGRWRIRRMSATAEGGALELAFGARRVYVVLGSQGRSRRLRVLLDGRPLPTRFAGADVRRGYVQVSSERLYELVDLPRVERHVLRLLPQAGVTGYAFTFG